MACAGLIAHSLARPVERQRQQRVLVAQLGPPPGQLAFALTGVEPGALPYGVVGVLDSQFGES